MRKELVRHSKFLSLVLRHDPLAAGVELDDAGWIGVDELLDALQRVRPGFTREVLDEVVATNDKRRFVLSEDGTRIRAAQGHSIGIELGLEPTAPPGRLFHGTAERNLASIREKGIHSAQRDYVHLSPDEGTAMKVGMRHGRPVALGVRAAAMAEAGHAFLLAQNGVWLTREIPPTFIDFPGA